MEERCTRVMGCVCPAVCIIIGQLFEALNVHRNKRTQRRNTTNYFRELEKAKAKLKTRLYREKKTTLNFQNNHEMTVTDSNT